MKREFTRDELFVMAHENVVSFPKWFGGKDIAGYIVDIEFEKLILEMRHLEFVRLLKAMAIHNIPITIELMERIEEMAADKVKI